MYVGQAAMEGLPNYVFTPALPVNERRYPDIGYNKIQKTYYGQFIQRAPEKLGSSHLITAYYFHITTYRPIIYALIIFHFGIAGWV